MSKTSTRVSLLLVVAVIGSACASAGSSGPVSTNVLTNADLVGTNEPDVYRAVQRLRPSWLRARGQTSVTSSTVVTLFVDGAPRGDVSSLGTISMHEVHEIEYLSASEAAFRFGTIAGSGGTLLVRTRR